MISSVKRILVVSLSNLGDVILTFPAIDILRKNFPSAHLAVVVGPKGEAFLKGNPNIQRVFVFDKHAAVPAMISWLWDLRREKYDLVVDLRHTAIALFLSPKHRTPLLAAGDKNCHKRLKHLKRLATVFPFTGESDERFCLNISEAEKKSVDAKLQAALSPQEPFAVISPGAADNKKRYPEEGFAQVADRLCDQYKLKIVFVGDARDISVAQRVANRMKFTPLDLCGKTSLLELAEILSRASLVIANDSAVMHLASYLDIPTLAIFGPTDSAKYGPWSSQSCIIEKKDNCPACQNQKKNLAHECLKAVEPHHILNAIKILPEGVFFASHERIS